MYKNIAYIADYSRAEVSKYYLLLFLFWPFLAFVLAIINYSKIESRRVVYFFMVYLGLTFVVNFGADGAEYARRLVNFSHLPVTDFFKMVGGMYSSDTTVDIVQPLITFIVSRFTSQHFLLFALFAAIFSISYIKSINLLYTRLLENKGWHTYMYMVFFVLILPVTSINGFRMWTATWIFFYGAYHVILYRKTSYFLVSFGACLVHFSFLSANAILVIYYFLGNRNVLYVPIAIASFILPNFLGPLFEAVSRQLGGALQTRYEMYSNKEYMSGIQDSLQEAVWYAKLGDAIAFYYFVIAVAIVGFSSKSQMNSKENKNIFSFLLLFLAFVNFGKSIPSFGGRFQVIFLLFSTLYLLIYFIKKPKNRLYPIAISGIFPMLLYAALQFRNASDCINIWVLVPGLGVPLYFPNMSLAEWLF